MPLDHSVVFDGGWRTLEGQVPFRDYTTPNALIPSFVQALFFWVFGVTWKAYVLHATVFNALFVVLVYVLLRLCGGRPVLAASYAALSALVFYPPVGVPFHDQHAFFFVLLAITLAVAARKAGPRTALALWTVAPIALAAAALSKQTPALLGAPIVVALAVAQRSRVRRALVGLVSGSAVAVGVVVVAALLARVDWHLVSVYFVELPLQTGGRRSSDGGLIGAPIFLLGLVFGVVGGGTTVIGARSGRRSTRPGEGTALALVLSVTFMVICAAFITVTRNDPLENMPLFFASFGLFHIALTRALPVRRPHGKVSFAAVVGAVVACCAVLAAWAINDGNNRRVAHNITFDEARVESDLPPNLSTMHFQVPDEYVGLHASDIRRVVEYLRSRPGPFVHFGDTTILNGLTGTSSVFPALFLADELTIPALGTSEHAAFERRLLEHIREERVRRVVVEPYTWEGVTLEYLPRFRAWLGDCARGRRTFGFFEVIEIRRTRECA